MHVYIKKNSRLSKKFLYFLREATKKCFFNGRAIKGRGVKGLKINFFELEEGYALMAGRTKEWLLLRFFFSTWKECCEISQIVMKRKISWNIADVRKFWNETVNYEICIFRKKNVYIFGLQNYSNKGRSNCILHSKYC